MYGALLPMLPLTSSFSSPPCDKKHKYEMLEEKVEKSIINSLKVAYIDQKHLLNALGIYFE